MNRRDVQNHELLHLFGGAAAIIEVAPEIYGKATAHLFASGTKGEEAIEFSGWVPDNVQFRIAALSAIAPVAEGEADLTRLFLKGTDSEIRRAGSLSGRDWILFRRWDGPPLTPVKIALAARAIHRGLGVSGMSRLRKAQKQHQDRRLDPLPLAHWVPESVARRALASAKDELKAALEGSAK